MLRTLVVGILALSAVVACGGGADTPSVKPGVTVGKVVEIAGTVTATRGTDARPLASGSEISGDDLIETAADARVAIVLAHNNARWNLGPNKKEKVGDSLAWKLAKQDTPAKPVDEATLAAGRHAERAAVTTTETAPGGGKKESAPEAAKSELRDEADPTPTAAAAPMEPRTGAATTPRPKGTASVAPSPGAPTPPQRPLPPPPPPPPPPTTDEALLDKQKPKDIESAPADKNLIAGDGLVKGPEAGAAPANAELQAAITKEQSAITACLDGKTLAVVIKVLRGKATFAFEGAVNAKTKTCLAKIAQRMKLPASETPYTVKLTLAK